MLVCASRSLLMEMWPKWAVGWQKSLVSASCRPEYGAVACALHLHFVVVVDLEGLIAQVWPSKGRGLISSFLGIRQCRTGPSACDAVSSADESNLRSLYSNMDACLLESNACFPGPGRAVSLQRWHVSPRNNSHREKLIPEGEPAKPSIP